MLSPMSNTTSEQIRMCGLLSTRMNECVHRAYKCTVLHLMPGTVAAPGDEITNLTADKP